MWTTPGPTVIKPPVVFVVLIVTWVNQPPISISTRDWHFRAAKCIHNAAKAIELDHRGMVNANAEVVSDRIFKQAWAAAGVAIDLAALISRVDALHADGWNVDPQITRDRDHGHLSFLRPKDGNHKRIRTIRGAGSFIGTDQKEVDCFVICKRRQRSWINAGVFHDRRCGHSWERVDSNQQWLWAQRVGQAWGKAFRLGEEAWLQNQLMQLL